jgi:ABC-2 type transport system ATP-binding protein
MTDLAIHTQGLGKRFGARAALEHFDLEVPRGCAFGFLGPNGAGRTTLIRLLLGLAKPTSGTIRLLGKDVENTWDVAAIVDKGHVIAQGPTADLVSTQTREIDIDAAPRVRAAGAWRSRSARRSP